MPLAPGTPCRGAGLAVLVTLNSPPTPQREENLLTRRSPSSPASRASPSPQAPLSLPTPKGRLLPTGSRHLRVLPGLGIRALASALPSFRLNRTVGPPPLLRFEFRLEVELAHPVDVGACRPWKGSGGHSAARWGVHASPWRLQEPLCARDGLLCLPPTLNSGTALGAAVLAPAHPAHVVPRGVALYLSGLFEDGLPHTRQGWVAGRTVRKHPS